MRLIWILFYHFLRVNIGNQLRLSTFHKPGQVMKSLQCIFHLITSALRF